MAEGFFKKLVSGLSKTRKSFSNGLNSVFKGFSKIDEDFYEELEEILIMSDIGVSVTEEILDNLRAQVKENGIREPEECRKLLMDELKAQMSVPQDAYDYENAPSVVLIVGVNGVGKTTSIGKLAYLYKEIGRASCRERV